jgi:hypothetical protein
MKDSFQIRIVKSQKLLDDLEVLDPTVAVSIDPKALEPRQSRELVSLYQRKDAQAGGSHHTRAKTSSLKTSKGCFRPFPDKVWEEGRKRKEKKRGATPVSDSR